MSRFTRKCLANGLQPPQYQPITKADRYLNRPCPNRYIAFSAIRRAYRHAVAGKTKSAILGKVADFMPLWFKTFCNIMSL